MSKRIADKKLLELAAKAAGLELAMYQSQEGGLWLDRKHANPITHSRDWNPLTDDGDALRLAVKLNFEMDIGRTQIHVFDWDGIKTVVNSDKEPDPYAATRRAIVRAAAEIGKTL